MTVDAINTSVATPALRAAIGSADAKPAVSAEPGERGETAAPAETLAVSSTAPAPETRDAGALVEAIETLRADLNAKFRSVLRIDRNEEAGRFTYSLVDPQTEETRFLWPPQNYLELIAFLRNPERGVVDENA